MGEGGHAAVELGMFQGVVDRLTLRSPVWPWVSEPQHVLQGLTLHTGPQCQATDTRVLGKAFTCPWHSGKPQTLRAVIFFIKINLSRFVYKNARFG